MSSATLGVCLDCPKAAWIDELEPAFGEDKFFFEEEYEDIVSKKKSYAKEIYDLPPINIRDLIDFRRRYLKSPIDISEVEPLSEIL